MNGSESGLQQGHRGTDVACSHLHGVKATEKYTMHVTLK